MASITAPGIGSGLDIGSLVSQLVAAEGEAKSVRLAQREAFAQAEISALGSLKSALSSFQSAVQGLDALSDFRQRSASSADEDLFTASADDKAVAGSYSIEVVNLAAVHKLASAGYTDSSTQVGSGVLTISTEGNTFFVNVDAAADTLADVRDAINNEVTNSGVSATIITVDDGSGGSESRLVLTSQSTGSSGAITITVDDDDGIDGDTGGLSALVYDPAPGSGVTNLTELDAALDALIRIDGQDVTRSTNSINDAIEGVTIDLVAAGSAVELTVALDEAAVTGAVSGFVSAYNSLINTISGLTAFDADTGAAGQLLGDATLRSVSNLLRRELSAEVEGVVGDADTLTAIGITTQDNGTLVLDTAVLDAAMSANFDDLGNLFAAADGIAVRLGDAIQPFVQANGTLDSRTDSLDARIDRIASQREALDRRLASVEERFLAQFIAMDALVSQLQTTSSFLDQQLTALNALSSRAGGSGR